MDDLTLTADSRPAKLVEALKETYHDADVEVGDDARVLTVVRDDDTGGYAIHGHSGWKQANDYMSGSPDLMIPYIYVDVDSAEVYGAVVTVEPDNVVAETLQID